MSVAIVTDTNSGIGVEEGRDLGIYVLPMPVLIDGAVRYEGVDLTPEEFYRLQAEGHQVQSCQATPGEVMRLWDQALQAHQELVYIPMTSGLSGACQTGKMLAAEYGGRVQVADNHRISVTQRNSVMDALDLADRGWSAAEIREELERTAYDSIIYIGVDTLEYLRRGGRITPAAAAMGTVLQIKPLLKIEGQRLDAYAKVRGRKGCMRRLVEAMEQSAAEFRRQGGPLCIGAAGSFLDPEERDAWIDMARQAFPEEEIFYDPLSLSIGCHVGPNAFGMAVTRRLSPAGRKEAKP